MSQPVSLPTAQTLDVAIIGAGLCGLALARVLTARGLRVQVLEARARLGGRVLTAHCDVTDQAVDLGPTWFWPETEPRMAALLLELGLPSLAQHDPGDVLWLTDPNRAPERSETAGGVHAGARRILGGIARLIEALEATLPTECVRTHMPVSGLRDCGSSIEISVQGGTVVHARQVVLAMPPRLVREHIQFEPALPDTVLQALEDSPTWMAAQAKALVTFAQPFWRAAGHSGNAFVRHPQAVLAEVFDCSSDAGAGAQAAALGGFVALNAAQRDQFRRSLPLLIESQLVQLYGVQAQSGNLHLQDWALERWTSSTTDRAKPPQPPQSQPLLRRSLWAERLFFRAVKLRPMVSGIWKGRWSLPTALRTHWRGLSGAVLRYAARWSARIRATRRASRPCRRLKM